MPKLLFYAGTVFCLFLALTSGGEALRDLSAGSPGAGRSAMEIAATLGAGLATAALLLRMSALLAARNLFGAFFSLLSLTGTTVALAFALVVRWRGHVTPAAELTELQLTGFLVLGFFVSLTMLSLRSYFSIQASRFLSALVCFPMPLFALVLAQETASGSMTTGWTATAAARVYFAVLAVLFAAIAVHCIRHRHLFLETTNLRELLDTRVDPASGTRHPRRPIGGVAFDS
jgi:hypothetical protein